MAMEDEKSSYNNLNEVEMAEAKHGNFIEPLPPSQSEIINIGDQREQNRYELLFSLPIDIVP